MRKEQNRVTQQWAHYPRSDAVNRKLAIFVHGFRGNYLRTWGGLPDYLVKTANPTPFDDWDYLFLGYDTAQVKTYLDIASFICENWRSALHGLWPYEQKYERFALIGHSLGTLGIRQALCATATHEAPLIESLHSVTLFGSPLNGSKVAFIASLRYKIAEALEPESAQLRMLKV